VDGLLHAAPRLKILASSREILGVMGEIPYRVPPLATPDPRRLPPLEELSRFDAVRLFVERARVVSPEFGITETTPPPSPRSPDA
jgi:non-specific serine/threonine protein kinase